MQKSSDIKRTGVYRVSGNIGDLQLELKLRHISEWLPVPKFEYVGAQSANAHGDHYPASEKDIWHDCYIHIPNGDDSYGGKNRLGYYCSYYNVVTGYTGNAVRRRRSPMAQHEEEEEEDKEKKEEEVTDVESQSNPSWSILSDNSRPPAGDLFYERNKELCNGAIATIRISWQQKHFSQAELERYINDPGSCASKLQRRYHNWALESLELQQRYLRKLENREDGEKEQDPETITVRRRMRKTKTKQRSCLTLVHLGGSSPSSANMSDVSVLDDPNFAARTCLIHTLLDTDPENLMPAEASEFHKKGYQLMYIYADLQQDTLLISIRYDPEQGLLYVYPDFSSSAQDLDYVVQIERNNDCRQLYAFGFENVTPLEAYDDASFPEETNGEEEQELGDGFTHEEDLPDKASAEEILEFYHRRRAAASERRSLLQFEMPPKRMRRVSLLLELQEGQNFENPNIHVRYYLKAPANTLYEGTPGVDPMQGATATCRNAGDWRTAHLGHCWQVTLLLEEQHHPADLMHIYFEVISIDGWQRERCEGYAHHAISLTSALPTDSIRLQCIRPLGNWLDALNRYFIGGRQLFDFESFFDVHRQSEVHTRLHFNSDSAMTTTGTLTLRLQKLQQRQVDTSSQFHHHFHLDLGNYSSDDGVSDEEDVKSSSNADTSRATTLDEVMAAFVEARERIEFLLETS
ncbi:Meckel syndrome type 1 protein homolog [Drosophila santomea]|uniref:Meckel syndrome type 1 protein homolog n=1 Tax=Drosophila santomea TaxID=129105 RepID=UPI001954CE64|nr:Meckel syndrome type 1 protein homolog [Drosophila santomea]